MLLLLPTCPACLKRGIVFAGGTTPIVEKPRKDAATIPFTKIRISRLCCVSHWLMPPPSTFPGPDERRHIDQNFLPSDHSISASGVRPRFGMISDARDASKVGVGTLQSQKADATFVAGELAEPHRKTCRGLPEQQIQERVTISIATLLLISYRGIVCRVREDVSPRDFRGARFST